MTDIPHIEAMYEPWVIAGNLDAQVHETHTGVVVLLGDRAYKAKKAIATDFLDFTTLAQREAACRREVALNSRLAPDSYLGVAHLLGPQGGEAEPVVLMRRYADSMRLSSMLECGHSVENWLNSIAETLADFHRAAERGPLIDEQGSVRAIAARWDENLTELQRYPHISANSVHDLRRLTDQYMAGRTELFTSRISDRRIVDGHADLLADDIFCSPRGLAILDCLEFDDTLRYVDGIDDASFLAMDLEFLGRGDFGALFLDRYMKYADDTAPRSLTDFYIAYRAVVRAKVECVRAEQGHPEAAIAARRHVDLALKHLRSGTVQLIIVGGGPGTGKSTVSHALTQQLGAVVVSTDDVRRKMRDTHAIEGEPGALNAGLYAPQNVAVVYDEVLVRAREQLANGVSVILDGTWRDPHQRQRAHQLAADAHTPIVEFTCSVSLDGAASRIRSRSSTTSDATPEIAAALAEHDRDWPSGHNIDTSRPLADSVTEALQVCRREIETSDRMK
ncbi:aminoglycoside phosphotransferase family enzyme/predicted kinase [Mycobacterium frederiksbergense]|uniref:Aminoglycoside phosphotransferase family enzyme/predicted kinase n=1 Tax=Mycolicibacterium frederiksbergense TaxID=117567 RepID=A0ABT6KTN8_9MYCO|nr:bifunctional aminoglycoside phosphotransferase/ATP-binding protein [Mycolicibacterium frederiksbergense]MDH6194014.1 aminoglycoside phosphotransferase family enzyme/predicted kinase [Mycolicibacterium frederiksbergense]